MRCFAQILLAVATIVRWWAAWLFSLVFPAAACFLLPILGPAQTWFLVARFWARSTLRILGIRVDLHGAEQLTAPAVFIANHQSLLDVILLPAILPAGTRFVARRNLRHIPFWGWLFIAGGAIGIERRPHCSGDTSRLQNGLARLPTNWSVMVFPEGTRRRDGQLARFRKGAFLCAAQLQLPVVPIGLDAMHQVAPHTKWLLYPGIVHVQVGKPITVNGKAAKQLQDAAIVAHKRVAWCSARANRRAAKAGAFKGCTEP